MYKIKKYCDGDWIQIIFTYAIKNDSFLFFKKIKMLSYLYMLANNFYTHSYSICLISKFGYVWNKINKTKFFNLIPFNSII
jgi:hypothetical protein